MSEVTRGHFTIDRARAREKLARYQLANPYAYVLELVQSAVLRGARRIDFQFDADDMIMRFDGEPYSAEDLSHLEMAVLEEADDAPSRSRRQLAAGLIAAGALNPARVMVDSYGGACLDIRAAGTREKLAASTKKSPETLIQLRERPQLKLLFKFWRNLKGTGVEQTLLKAHCAAAEGPITVNGTLVSRRPWGFCSGKRVGEVAVAAEGLSGWGGFVLGEPSELEVYMDGVRIETVKLDLGPLPFRAVIHAKGLEKDLSGAALQRNTAFERLMVDVATARERAVEKLCETEEAVFFEETRRELLALGDIKKLQDDTTYPGCLAKLRVWNLVNGERATFQELSQALAAHSFLPYSTEYGGGQAIEGLPIVWLSEKSLHADMKKLHHLRNVTRRLRSLRETEKNRERWRSTPTEAKLQGRGYLATQDVRGVGLSGQLGVRKTDTPAAVRLIKDGCLLSEIFPPNWPLGVDLVMEADFEPTPNYDGVKPNQTLEAALICGLKPLPAIIERIAKPSSIPFFWSKPQSTLNIVADYLRLASRPEPLRILLESCGIVVEDPAALQKLSGWSTFSMEQSSALLDVRWLSTETGEKRSLREIVPGKGKVNSSSSLALDWKEKSTLRRLLGEEAVQDLAPADGCKEAHDHGDRLDVPEEGWLEEEFFLAALRAELRHLGSRDDDTLVSDIRTSRIVFSDQSSEVPVELNPSGLILLFRGHPLVVDCLSHYRKNPAIFVILISLLLSALNRRAPKVTDSDEARLQEALLDHALSLHSNQRTQRSLEAGEPQGYLEPFCDSGYGTGWAYDPSGLGVRFYLDEPPSLRSEPLLILDLNSPRVDHGGHDFLFELPRELLDGRRLKIWACLVDPATQQLHNLSGSPRVFAPALRPPAPPVGWLEEVSPTGLATGWCLDPNRPDGILSVEFYLDGNHLEGEYVGACKADQAKSEVLELTGYEGQHGFSFQVPEQHNDGSAHKLWAYTFDLEKVSINPLLKGAPLSFGSKSAAPTVSREDADIARRVREETLSVSSPQVERCEGRTRSGEQCKRSPQTGSRYCYQHFGE